MDGGLLDELANLTLVTMIFAEPSVSVSDLLVKVELVVVGVAGHELRLAQRKLVTLVCLPQVEDLAVQCDNVFHLFVLCNFPDSCRNTSGTGHKEHARLDFEDVRVPVFALFVLKGFVETGADHVLDADETGVWFWRVVEEALSHLWKSG